MVTVKVNEFGKDLVVDFIAVNLKHRLTDDNCVRLTNHFFLTFRCKPENGHLLDRLLRAYNHLLEITSGKRTGTSCCAARQKKNKKDSHHPPIDFPQHSSVSFGCS